MARDDADAHAFKWLSHGKLPGKHSLSILKNFFTNAVTLDTIFNPTPGGGSESTHINFLAPGGGVLGGIQLEGDPFGLGGGAQTPIKAMSIFDADGTVLGGYSKLDPIDPAVFSAKFLDLARSYLAVFDDFVALSNGGCTATGGADDESFNMGSGPNIVTSGAGDDALHKSAFGFVSFNGGPGTDTFSFVGEGSQAFPNPFTQTMVVNLATGKGQNPYGGKLVLSGVENIVGTSNADIITGNNKANVFGDGFQDGGADIIKARGGDDIVNAVDVDLIHANGGAGFDIFRFLGDIDLQDADFAARVTNFEKFEVFSFFILPPPSTMRGDAGANWFQGDAGEDTLEGRGGNDRIDGGDALKSDFSQGVDVAVWSGKRAQYTIRAEGGTVTVTDNRPGSPDGADTVVNVETLRFKDKDLSVAALFPKLGEGFFGTSGDDVLGPAFGTTRNISVYGLAGDDTLADGAGNDLLVGGTGDDVYVLGGGTDRIVELPGEGIDTIEILWNAAIPGLSLANYANVENLTTAGFSGQRLIGNGLDNVITSWNGGDVMNGGAGNDTLFGGSGSDRMNGGKGDDRLIGGASAATLGADVMTGGSGHDVFVFLTATDSTLAATDVITDFNARNADIIDLSAIDAIAGGKDDAFTFRGGNGFTGDGQVRVIHVGGNTFIDINIGGTTDPEMRIELTGVVQIGLGDLIL